MESWIKLLFIHIIKVVPAERCRIGIGCHGHCGPGGRVESRATTAEQSRCRFSIGAGPTAQRKMLGAVASCSFLLRVLGARTLPLCSAGLEGASLVYFPPPSSSSVFSLWVLESGYYFGTATSYWGCLGKARRCGRWGGSLRPRRQSWAGAAGIGGAQRWGGGGEALACFQGMRRRGVRWSARTVVLRWAQERCSMECPHGCAGAGCKRGVQGNAREAVVVFLGGRR